MLVAILVSVTPLGQLILGRFSGLGQSGIDQESFVERFALWKEALRLFGQSPLIGIGPFSFLTKGRIGYHQIHNYWLQLLTELGLLGFVVFAMLFGMIFLWLCRISRSVSPPWRGVVIGVVIAWIAIIFSITRVVIDLFDIVNLPFEVLFYTAGNKITPIIKILISELEVLIMGFGAWLGFTGMSIIIRLLIRVSTKYSNLVNQYSEEEIFNENTSNDCCITANEVTRYRMLLVRAAFVSIVLTIIEGLRLRQVEAGSYFCCCLPLYTIGIEAAPARAVLLEQ